MAEVASAITCEAISRGVSSGLPLKDVVFGTNRKVISAVAEGRGKKGMASTVVAVHFNESHYQSHYRVAWMGDSRAYLWDGQLKLLTQAIFPAERVGMLRHLLQQIL